MVNRIYIIKPRTLFQLLSQNAITTINTVSLNNDIALKNANFAILVDVSHVVLMNYESDTYR